MDSRQRVVCRKCLQEKDISRFEWRNDNQSYRKTCKDCQSHQKLARKIYLRENEPEKFAEIQDSKRVSRKFYKEQNKERISLADMKYRQENKEKILNASRRYKRENRDLHNQRNRDYSKTPAGMLANRKKLAKYRANKQRAIVASSNLGKISEVYSFATRLELWLGVEYHVDHIIPLNSSQVCGLHVHSNLRAIPAVENLSKSNNFNSNDFNVVQTKERQDMNKYFNVDQADDEEFTGNGSPPDKPPVKPPLNP